MSSRPGSTHTILWRSEDYSCLLVTHPDTGYGEVHIYKDGVMIGFETGVEPENTVVVAERFRAAVIKPV